MSGSNLAVPALGLAAIAVLAAGAALYLGVTSGSSSISDRVAALEAHADEAEQRHQLLFSRLAEIQKKLEKLKTGDTDKLAREVELLRSEMQSRQPGLTANDVTRIVRETLSSGREQFATGPDGATAALPPDTLYREGLAAYDLACAHVGLDVLCQFKLISPEGVQSAIIPPTLGRVAAQTIKCIRVDGKPCRETPYAVQTTAPLEITFTMPSHEYAPRQLDQIVLMLGDLELAWEDVEIQSD